MYSVVKLLPSFSPFSPHLLCHSNVSLLTLRDCVLKFDLPCAFLHFDSPFMHAACHALCLWQVPRSIQVTIEVCLTVKAACYAKVNSFAVFGVGKLCLCICSVRLHYCGLRRQCSDRVILSWHYMQPYKVRAGMKSSKLATL